jgi:hypothetical protein
MFRHLKFIDWAAIGKRIRQLLAFELTQMEFARRVGVSRGYLSGAETRWEHWYCSQSVESSESP